MSATPSDAATVGRTALGLAPLAVLSRGVAFFVPVAVARVWGAIPATDAFFWALGVPTFVLVLAAMAVATVLIVPLSELRARAPDRVPGFVGAALLAAAAAAAAFAAIFAALSPVAAALTTRFDPETTRLAARAAWTLVPFASTVAAATVARVACEAHGAFRVSVGAPLARGAVVIGAVVASAPAGAEWLPACFLAGNLVEIGILVWALGRVGAGPAWPRAWPPELTAALTRVAPVLGGEGLVASNLLVDRAFAATLAAGSVSLLEYADRAQMIPRTLLESTLVSVAFAGWAAARARGDDEARRAAVATSLWWVLLFAPPMLAGLSVGRVALARLLYGGGTLSAEQLATVAANIDAFLPGVLFGLLGALIVKAHVVEGRTTLVLGLGLMSFALNASLNVALIGSLGLVGLAASSSITTAVVTVVSFVRLAPELRGALGPRAAAAAVLVVLGSLGVTIVAHVFAFAPATVLDPWLWAASLPCFGLLAFAASRARAGGGS